jgi:hypothetical protein
VLLNKTLKHTEKTGKNVTEQSFSKIKGRLEFATQKGKSCS